MSPGNWNQHIATVAPLAVSAGIVALGPLATAVSATGPVIATMGASLATNLIAGGLSALCKPSGLKAGEEYREQLANHDIRRLINTSWSEAAAATVAKYAEFYSSSGIKADPLSLKYPPPPKEFLEVVRHANPKDFNPRATVGTIRAAIAAARRSLLPDASRPTGEIKFLETLRNDLAASVVESLIKKSPGQITRNPPEGFMNFLAGSDPRFPGGILGQLCIFVALHLKNDSRAQIAILHFTLQEIADSQADVQARLDELYDLISKTKDYEAERHHAFETQVRELTQTIGRQIERAFNNFVQPTLEVPFANTAVNTLAFPFTYMARHIPLIGRENAMDALIAFLSDPIPGLWTVISGAAGSGKSRLAAELIARVSDGCGPEVTPGKWRAGFLRQTSWLATEGLKWQPDADTLLVIDYADALPLEGLSPFLAKLRKPGRIAECAVRVILIDRMPPYSDLGLVTQLSKGDRQGDVLQTLWPQITVLGRQDIRFGEPYSSRCATKDEASDRKNPLDLEPVSEQSAFDIAHAWAASELTAEVEARLRSAFGADEELCRPLFASLLGHAIGTDGMPAGELNPVTVSATALSHQFRAIDESGTLWEAAKDLFALATAGQGIAETELLRRAEAITGEPLLSRARREELINRLRRMNGTAPGGVIPPLEPDFLGGLFVLERAVLSEHFVPERAGALADAAWACGRAPREFFDRLGADFLGRGPQLARALSHSGLHLSHEQVNETLVRLLLSATGSNALANGGPSVLANAVYRASSAGEIAVARRLLDGLEAADVERNFRSELAQAWLGYALSGGLPESAYANADEALERIRGLVRSGPDPVARAFATALFSRTRLLLHQLRWDEARDALRELQDLHRDHPDPAVRDLLAEGLWEEAAAAYSTGVLLRRGEAHSVMRDLRELHNDDPDPFVRELLASALSNFVRGPFFTEIGLTGEDADEFRRRLSEHVDEAIELVRDLRRLHDAHAEVEVRHQLATALLDCGENLQEVGRVDEARKLLHEVRDLCVAYPDPAMRSRLLKAFLDPAFGPVWEGNEAAEIDRRRVHLLWEGRQDEALRLYLELEKLLVAALAAQNKALKERELRAEVRRFFAS